MNREKTIMMLVLFCAPFLLFGQSTIEEKKLRSDPSNVCVHLSAMYTVSDTFFFKGGMYISIEENYDENAFVMEKGVWRHAIGSPLIKVTITDSIRVRGSGDSVSVPPGEQFFEKYSITESHSKKSLTINWAELVKYDGVELGSHRYTLSVLDPTPADEIWESRRNLAEEVVKRNSHAYAASKKRQEEGEPW